MHTPSRIAMFTVTLAAVVIGNTGLAETKQAPDSKSVAIVANNTSAATQSPDLRGTMASPLVIETVKSAEDTREKQQEAKYRNLDSSSGRWVMLLTAGMLVVAAVQAWFFLIQLRVMSRSLKVAESAALAADRTVETMQDTTRRQLRAYVSIDRAWIEFPEPGVSNVTVVIKNAGQTPAHDLHQWIHQWIEKYPLKVQLPTPPDGFAMSASLLGAGATHNMCIEHPQPIIKLPFLDQIGTPEATIYVYGEVTYKDVFGEQHFVRYRLMYGGPHKPPLGILSPCEEGNEAS